MSALSSSWQCCQRFVPHCFSFIASKSNCATQRIQCGLICGKGLGYYILGKSLDTLFSFTSANLDPTNLIGMLHRYQMPVASCIDCSQTMYLTGATTSGIVKLENLQPWVSKSHDIPSLWEEMAFLKLNLNSLLKIFKTNY